MNAIIKTKFAFYLALIFAAGAVSGSVLAFHKARAKAEPPTMEKVCHRMDGRLKRHLGLTDEEFSRIRPILERNTIEIERIQNRTLQEIDATIRRNYDEIGRLLTPEQRQKLQELEAERRDFMARRGKIRDFDHRPPSPRR